MASEPMHRWTMTWVPGRVSDGSQTRTLRDRNLARPFRLHSPGFPFCSVHNAHIHIEVRQGLGGERTLPLPGSEISHICFRVLFLMKCFLYWYLTGLISLILIKTYMSLNKLDIEGTYFNLTKTTMTNPQLTDVGTQLRNFLKVTQLVKWKAGLKPRQCGSWVTLWKATQW